MSDYEQQTAIVNPYLQRAKEIEGKFPKIAYYLRSYAVQLGIEKIQKRDPKFQKQLFDIISQVEQQKPGLSINKQTDYQQCEGFARQVFEKADTKDRDGLADMSTSQAFYAAAIFLQVLDFFKDQYGGHLPQDLQDKIKYAKWKATDIRTAIKEGRKPIPGGPADRVEGDEAEKIEDELGLQHTSKPNDGFTSGANPQSQEPSKYTQGQNNTTTRFAPQANNYQSNQAHQSSYQQPNYPKAGADSEELDSFPEVPSSKKGHIYQNNGNSSFAQPPQNDPNYNFPSPPKLSKMNSSRWGRISPGMRVLYLESPNKQPQKGVVTNCEDAIFEVSLTNNSQTVTALEDDLAPDLDRGANVVWTQDNGGAQMCQITDIYLNQWPPMYTLRLPNGLTQKVSSTNVMVPDQDQNQEDAMNFKNNFKDSLPLTPRGNTPYTNTNTNTDTNTNNNQTVQNNHPNTAPSQNHQYAQSGQPQSRQFNSNYQQSASQPKYPGTYPSVGQGQKDSSMPPQGNYGYPNTSLNAPQSSPSTQDSYPNASASQYPSYPSSNQGNLQNQSNHGATQGQQHQNDEEEREAALRNPGHISVQTISQAQKFARYAVSSLNFNDVESAITNLEQALKILK